MNVLKQIITKASLTTIVVSIGLVNSPVKAETNKQCTYEANNRITCTSSGSGSSRTVRQSSSSKTTLDTNVNVDISEKVVENLFKGILGNGSNESKQTNQNRRQNNIPNIPGFGF
ncbi:hypothetical protein [Myxosarcina sp. GI1]|uniref:hypothetical protein n=1 Tax=Myxosarcina sp. GI1 TaxID=1541065 RepID=UPI00056CB8A0|nr:hypothetical protein [Myxosarcina sp. GI1]